MPSIAVAAVFLIAASSILSPANDSAYERHQVSAPGVTLAIAQTNEGHIWFGTSNGLFRYDGQTMLRVPLAAADGPVRLLLARKGGGLWAATGGGYLDSSNKNDTASFSIALREGGGGLSLVQGLSSSTILAANGTPGSWVWSLAERSDGALWVGTESGLIQCSNTKSSCVNVATSRKGIIGALLSEGNGDLWIGDAQGLWRLSSTFDNKLPVVSFSIRGLVRQSNTQIWAMGEQKLSLLENSVVASSFSADEKNNLRTIAPGVLPHNALVGSTRGLLQIKDSSLVPATLDIPKQSIRSILKDREGSLWLTSKGSGILQMRVPAVRNWAENEGLIGGVPLAILRDRSGSVLINTNAGLLTWSQSEFRKEKVSPDAAPWNRRQLAQSPSGDIWMAWDDVVRFSPVSETTDVLSFSNHDGARALHVDAQGDVWIGWQTGGISQFHASDIHLRSPRDFSSQHGLCPGSTTLIVEANVRSGAAFWIAGSGGIARWQDGSAICTFPSTETSFGQITGLLEDRNSTLWITAVGQTGLWAAKDGKVKPIQSIQPFPGTSLYGLTTDGGPYLWFSSSRGVFRAATAELLRSIEAGVPPRVYQADERTGMRSADGQSTYQPNIISNGRGGVLVSTAHGISEILSPDDLPVPKVTVVIDAVQVESTLMSVKDNMEIDSQIKNLEVRFSVATFLARSAPRVTHKLEGWDRDFISDNEVRVVRYAALPPGRYTFRLRASSNESGDSLADSESSWQFVVTPAWHQRLVVRVLAVVSFLFMAFVLHRLRTARIRKGFEAIQTERTRIARDLHDGLAQFFVGLGLQLEALRSRMRSSPEQSSALISELKTMTRDAQIESRRVIWGLRGNISAQSVTAAVQSAVVDARQKLGLRVTSKFVGIVPQSRVLQEELPRITSEALTNAVRHGRASATHVEVAATDTALYLTIDDNGEGLNVAQSEEISVGLGLVGIRERASRFGGTVTLQQRPQGGARLSVKIGLPL